MVQRNPRPRAGFTLIELLVVMAIMASLAAMGMAGYQKVLAVQKRIECSNNLRQIGLAMLSFDTTSTGFPSDARTDQKDGSGKQMSFYAQIASNLELDSLMPNNTPTTNGQAKPFVCAGRRTAAQAPGACDYGYVASSALGGGKAVLDSPTGISASQISAQSGTTNTAVLSHFWITPTAYSNPTPGWASPTGHSVTKAQKGYKDTDSSGSGSLGSPHSTGMPCIFADGHVGVLGYTYPQFSILWDYTSTVAKNGVP